MLIAVYSVVQGHCSLLPYGVQSSDMNDPIVWQLPVNLLSNVAWDLEALILKLHSCLHLHFIQNAFCRLTTKSQFATITISFSALEGLSPPNIYSWGKTRKLPASLFHVCIQRCVCGTVVEMVSKTQHHFFKHLQHMLVGTTKIILCKIYANLSHDNFFVHLPPGIISHAVKSHLLPSL